MLCLFPRSFPFTHKQFDLADSSCIHSQCWYWLGLTLTFNVVYITLWLQLIALWFAISYVLELAWGVKISVDHHLLFYSQLVTLFHTLFLMTITTSNSRCCCIPPANAICVYGFINECLSSFHQGVCVRVRERADRCTRRRRLVSNPATVSFSLNRSVAVACHLNGFSVI